MLRQHLVTKYDTLRDLALHYLGSADRWTEIAIVNGFKTADLTAVIGKQIALPLEDPGEGSDQYKVDLSIMHGDLVETASGDLGAVGGKDNYALSLIRMCNTAPGDLRQHPSLGLDVDGYAGEAIVGLAGPLLRVDVERLLLSDPRTAKVIRNEAVFLPSQKRVAIQATVEDVEGGISQFEYERNLTDG